MGFKLTLFQADLADAINKVYPEYAALIPAQGDPLLASNTNMVQAVALWGTMFEFGSSTTDSSHLPGWSGVQLSSNGSWGYPRPKTVRFNDATNDGIAQQPTGSLYNWVSDTFRLPGLAKGFPLLGGIYPNTGPIGISSGAWNLSLSSYTPAIAPAGFADTLIRVVANIQEVLTSGNAVEIATLISQYTSDGSGVAGSTGQVAQVQFANGGSGEVLVNEPGTVYFARTWGYTKP